MFSLILVCVLLGILELFHKKQECEQTVSEQTTQTTHRNANTYRGEEIAAPAGLCSKRDSLRKNQSWI